MSKKKQVLRQIDSRQEESTKHTQPIHPSIGYKPIACLGCSLVYVLFSISMQTVRGVLPLGRWTSVEMILLSNQGPYPGLETARSGSYLHASGLCTTPGRKRTPESEALQLLASDGKDAARQKEVEQALGGTAPQHMEPKGVHLDLPVYMTWACKLRKMMAPLWKVLWRSG